MLERGLYVASGLSYRRYVVNQAFLQQLAAVLDRATTAYCRHWRITTGVTNGYVKALPHLEALEAQYANLQIIQKHTHQKGIVVDNRYAIVGSFNFLSNAKVQRDETSLKYMNPMR